MPLTGRRARSIEGADELAGSRASSPTRSSPRRPASTRRDISLGRDCQALADADLGCLLMPRELGGQAAATSVYASALARIAAACGVDLDRLHDPDALRPPHRAQRHAATSGSGGSPRSAPPRRWAPSRSPSRRRARTWPRCARPPDATATATGSTGARSSSRTVTSPTSSCCSRPSTRPSARQGITAFLVDDPRAGGLRGGQADEQARAEGRLHRGAELRRLPDPRRRRAG